MEAAFGLEILAVSTVLDLAAPTSGRPLDIRRTPATGPGEGLV